MMSRMSRKIVILVILGALLLSACGPAAFLAVQATPTAADSKIDPAVSTASKEFGIQLFKEVAGKTKANIFFSPFLVTNALHLLVNGAGGDTLKAMKSTLDLEAIESQTLNSSNAAILQKLFGLDPEKIQLDVANSLWLSDKVKILDSFRQINALYYASEVQSVPFTSNDTIARINAWVKQRTHDQINQIVSQLDPDMVALLVGAIFFKGDWTHPFRQTEAKPFTLQTGEAFDYPLMSQSGYYQYVETSAFQAIALPYDGGLEMRVFLPAKTSNLGEFEEWLNAETWAEWNSWFAVKDGKIELPRFQLDYEVSLKDALTSLGLGVLFDRNMADFSGAFPEGAALGDVQQKATLKVNEEGTVAVAVQVDPMITGSAPPTPIDRPGAFLMIVNRPFFFTIQDQASGSFLFMGEVQDPRSPAQP